MNYRLAGMVLGLLILMAFHLVKLQKFYNEYKLLVRELNGARLELSRSGRVVYRDKIKEKIVYVPSEGKATIQPKDPNKKLEDVVDIKITKFGLTKRVGFQADVLNRGYGPDFKFLYFGRFGLSGGGLFYPSNNPLFATNLSLSYKLDRLWLFDNTEAFIGWRFLISQRNGPLVLGLRINL